ncbi:hypothetical protein METHB2_10194 [Candidatus Methylobacter favarea]|uniref:Uncharacterized protein n=1 Tax=Candidatus Methylobacter favarea TaxID=2707345 RepID=A0A8S0W8L1_9GAMM|nr:hypothetical protein METHB2_10194 [Candidatus Methylobacter favarea]
MRTTDGAAHFYALGVSVEQPIGKHLQYPASPLQSAVLITFDIF